MQKDVVLGIVLTVICVVGGQMVLTGQDRNGAQRAFRGALIVDRPQAGDVPAIEIDIRTLFEKLQQEAMEGQDRQVMAGHEDLRIALSRYMNRVKFQSAIEILETTVKDMPGTDEARRAELAIQLLKGKNGARNSDVQQGPSIDQRPTPIEQRLQEKRDPYEVPQF